MKSLDEIFEESWREVKNRNEVCERNTKALRIAVEALNDYIGCPLEDADNIPAAATEALTQIQAVLNGADE